MEQKRSIQGRSTINSINTEDNSSDNSLVVSSNNTNKLHNNNIQVPGIK